LALRVLTAFRPSGIYKEEHIERLSKQVKEFSGIELECIHGEYAHWWCKMTVFKEEGPVLYFDLDTTIVGNLDPLLEVAESERFVTLRDFNYPKKTGSGVMSWNYDIKHIHDEFAENPQRNIAQYPGGDQDFIAEGGYCQEYWQDLLPNHIQSYKVHIRKQSLHPECRVVCYHGRPKGWDVNPKTGVEYDAELRSK